MLNSLIFNNYQFKVDHVLNGYNACCFAYGQTGSGKTHSMFGGEGDSRGMVPRAIEYLFHCLQRSSNQVVVYCSLLEIYNEQLRDLGKVFLLNSDTQNNSSSGGIEKTTDLFSAMELKRKNSFFARAFNKSGSTS